MLSLLFGGALRLGGGFAVLGLALIALIALLSGRIGGSGLSGLPRLGRYGGIELLVTNRPSPDVVSIGSGTAAGSATARVGVGVGMVLAVSVRFRRGGRRVETNSGCTSTNGL